MEENTQNSQQGLTDEQLMAAKQEIEEVLQKHKIVLIPITIHHGDRVFSRIDVAPAPDAQIEQPTENNQSQVS